jgi:hypothetical protein
MAGLRPLANCDRFAQQQDRWTNPPAPKTASQAVLTRIWNKDL